MKKMIMSVLLLCSAAGKLYAQEMPAWSLTRTEKMFSANPYLINHKHTVRFTDGNSLIVELGDKRDYDILQRLDSFTRIFRKDWVYYRDSIKVPPSGSIRIDYVFAQAAAYQALRFKTYEGDGDMYRSYNGVQSRIKLDKDTVRFLIPSNRTIEGFSVKLYRPIQLTFVLKSYKDIDALLDGKELYDVIDTLAATKISSQRSTIFYTQGGKMTIYKNMYRGDFGSNINDRDQLVFNLRMGVGLVRNQLSPMADLMLQFKHHLNFSRDRQFLIAGLTAAPYFFFSQNAEGKYNTQINWFLNADIGAIGLTSNSRPFSMNSLTAGVGYLLQPDGKIFNGTTMKAFVNVGLKSNLTISPELIFTDNFRQVFPAFTVKIF